MTAVIGVGFGVDCAGVGETGGDADADGWADGDGGGDEGSGGGIGGGTGVSQGPTDVGCGTVTVGPGVCVGDGNGV